MNKDVDVFLRISKGKYFNNKDFSPIDILIMSQIEEFERNNKKCFISDETMANNFNVSVSTISRALEHLESKKYIVRKVTYENVGGKVKKTRQLSISNVSYQNEKDMTNQNDLLKDNTIKDKKDNIIIQQNEEKDKKENCMQEEVIIIKPKPRVPLLQKMLNE